jgi:hypothetical protein
VLGSRQASVRVVAAVPPAGSGPLFPAAQLSPDLVVNQDLLNRHWRVALGRVGDRAPSRTLRFTSRHGRKRPGCLAASEKASEQQNAQRLYGPCRHS